MRKKKLISIDSHYERFKSVQKASVDLGVSYVTYKRWLDREVVSPEDSSWRRLIALENGVELPRRGRGA